MAADRDCAHRWDSGTPVRAVYQCDCTHPYRRVLPSEARLDQHRVCAGTNATPCTDSLATASSISSRSRRVGREIVSDAQHYMDDPLQLFDRTKDYVVVMRFYENDFTISMEELYQAFKARLLEDFSVERGGDKS
jgi:hypothetical protein